MPKLRIAMSETHSQPHFASHTQSSLMKTRTPKKLKKNNSSLMKDMSELKKLQGNITSKLNGIHKRRSNIMKQSKSMQMLIMILKQQRDRRTIDLPSSGSSELTETSRLLESSIVSLPSDLIKDISRDLKQCISNPTKSATLCGNEQTKVNKSEKRTEEEDSHSSSQDGLNSSERDNSGETLNSSEDHATADVACKLELHLSDEEKKSADSCREVEIHHQINSNTGPPPPPRFYHRIESGEKLNDFANEACSEAQTRPEDVNATKRKYKVWQKNRKFWTRNEHVDNQQNNWSANKKSVVNTNATTTRKRDAFQKDLVFYQRAWRPPGIAKTRVTESVTSLQSMSQKSSLSVEKSTASTKSKRSSIEDIDESTSASVSINQTTALMKENRDPRANRMTKISEQLTETKQHQRLQGGGTFPKKRRSKTKIGQKVLNERDDVKSQIPKSKSRQSQTQPIMPKESSNISNVEQHCTESTLVYSKRTRTREVIHTLKEIIDSVKEDENAEEDVTKNDNDHEKNDSEIPKSLDRDTLWSNKTCTTDVNWNRAEILSPRRSISTQTDFDILSYHKIDAKKDKDSMEILRLTQTVATQTSPRCNRNAVEIGCNTSNVVCNDVGVSCDFVDPTNLKTEVDLIMFEDKSMSDIPSSIKHVEINIGSGDTNKNEKHLLDECKKMLNAEMHLKLENCSNVEILAKMTDNEAKKTVHEEACHVSIQSSKKFDDKTNTDIDKQQESTKWFNNYGASSTSVNNLFLERSRSSIYEYTASCSSEEVAECLKNDEDTVTSELRVKGIPNDVIAAFELAAERAHNLYKAFIIYRENLMSKEFEKRNEETVDDCDEMSKQRDHRHRLEKCASFINCGNEYNTQNEKINFEYEHDFSWLACMGKNTVEFSSCSSSSDKMSEFEYLRRLKDLDQELNDKPEDTMSLMELMRTTGLAQDEYALEILQLERNIERKRNKSFDTESMENHKILALPATIKETSIMSRENLLPLICCVICTIVFWFLQFSFRCDVTK